MDSNTDRSGTEHLSTWRASRSASPHGQRIREFYESQEGSIPAKNPVPKGKQAVIPAQYHLDLSSIQNEPTRAIIERMQTALQNIIQWNQDHALHESGDANKAESWSCIKECRASLSFAQNLLNQESNTK